MNSILENKRNRVQHTGNNTNNTSTNNTGNTNTSSTNNNDYSQQSYKTRNKLVKREKHCFMFSGRYVKKVFREGW